MISDFAKRLFNSVGFIALAYFMTEIFNPLNVILNEKDRIFLSWVEAGIGFLLMQVALAIYVVGYWGYVKGYDIDPDHFPKCMPAATTLFMLTTACFFVGFWPAWKILTPVIQFVYIMALIQILKIPNWFSRDDSATSAFDTTKYDEEQERKLD